MKTTPLDQRPAIVLTEDDRSRLTALVEMSAEEDVARFLREEIARAAIVRTELAGRSLITMGSRVRFVERGSSRIQEVELAYPEEADERGRISVLTPVGSALIGLGPGQSIGWIESGVERRLFILDVIG